MSQYQPNVSIVVPVYQSEKYLRICLESLLEQTLKNIEIILVDENDLDECRRIMDDYEAADSRIVTIHQKNGGYGASVNLGIRSASGEYIGIVESDDYVPPEFYEEIYCYAKLMDADVVKTPFYDYYEYPKRGKPIKILNNDCRFLRKHLPKNRIFSIREYPCLMGGHASIWSGIYRTSYLKDNEIYFPEVQGGGYVDAIFRPMSLIYTEKIAWLDKPFYCWRKTSEGSTTNNFNLSAMLQRWSEVHALFQNFPGIYKLVGPFSVDNEYGCTLAIMYQSNFTNEQYEAFLQNLSFTDRSLIEVSPILGSRKKYELLAAKENPEQFYWEILRKQKSQKILRPLMDNLFPKGTRVREYVKNFYHSVHPDDS